MSTSGQVNKPRYNQGRQPEIQEHLVEQGGRTQRFDSPPTPILKPENEYSVIHKPNMSGSQMAHLLTDKNRGSPKYSHNTNRPPTTFSRPMTREPNLEQVRDKLIVLPGIIHSGGPQWCSSNTLVQTHL